MYVCMDGVLPVDSDCGLVVKKGALFVVQQIQALRETAKECRRDIGSPFSSMDNIGRALYNIRVFFQMRQSICRPSLLQCPPPWAAPLGLCWNYSSPQ